MSISSPAPPPDLAPETNNLFAEPTAQNANTLAGLVRLVVQMTQLNPNSAEIAQVTQNLAIKTAGTAIQLTLAIPESLIEQMGPAKRAPRVRKVVNMHSAPSP
jgi:hypothetical protein